MNEKHGFFQKLGKALNGKGFYMVLLLCLMLLGASGFYLYRTVTAPSAPEQSASGQAEVVVTSPLPEESTTTAQNSSEVQVTSEPAPAEDPAPSEDISTAEGTDEAAAAPMGEEAEPASAPVLYWPAGGEVVSAFSSSELTYNAAMGDWRTHNGIDIAAGLGTDVCAAADGVVERIATDPVTGTTVTLAHADGLRTIYGDLDADTVAVSEGDSVSCGDVLACVGSSAGEEGETAFLHFAVMADGQAVDPMDYLSGS